VHSCKNFTAPAANGCAARLSTSRAPNHNQHPEVFSHGYDRKYHDQGIARRASVGDPLKGNRAYVRSVSFNSQVDLEAYSDPTVR